MLDQELEQLRQRVREILGDEAYGGALRRAMDVASRMQVLEHALSKRGHRTLLCEGLGSFQAFALERMRREELRVP